MATRRDVLRLMVASAALSALPLGCAEGPPIPVPEWEGDPFTLGVASGDPMADSVILWTRLAPKPLEGGGMPQEQVPVKWQLAEDEGFSKVRQEAYAIATPELGHSLHIDVKELPADSWFWYRFQVGQWTSPVGRARTLPASDATPSMLRIAQASCQDWKDGYYTSYPHLVADKPDFVFFLGDYIYESGMKGDVRDHNSEEVTDLVGYRNRYALYRGDKGLQDAHASCPWIVTWDDHEVDNDYAGDTQEKKSTFDKSKEAFLQRRAAAYQAYYEHQPLRVPAPEGPNMKLYRSFRCGTLATFFVLDTRQYRSDQRCEDEGSSCEVDDTPARTMLGEEQEEWLKKELAATKTTWRVLAQQVVMATTTFGGFLTNWDQWDGYAAARKRLLDYFVAQKIPNLVVLTGDLHAAGVATLHEDPDDAKSPVVATEFLTTAISSGYSLDGDPKTLEQLVTSLRQVRFFNIREKGYILSEITPTSWRAHYRMVSGIDQPTATVRTASSWERKAGSTELQDVT